MENPNLDIRIAPDEALTERERHELDYLLKTAFVDDVDYGWAWAQPTVHVSGFVGGRLASHVGLLTRDITVGGRKLRIAGVSDVATHADFRQKGLAKRLMLAAEDHLRREGQTPFVLLFCNPNLVHYYAGCGYRQVTAPLFITSEGRRFPIDEIKMVLTLGEQPWPEGEIDLQGLPW